MSEIEYKLRHYGEYIRECHFCDCEVPLGEFNWEIGEEHEESDKIKYLCEVCSITNIASTRRYEQDFRTHKIIAEVVNHLKQKLNLF